MDFEERKKKIEQYNEEKKKRNELSNLVVKDNALIQKASYNLTAIQQKFIIYLISKVKPESQEKELDDVEIKVSDFCEIAGIDTNYFYSEFINMIDDFDNNRSFWIDEDKQIYKFRWFSDTRYLKGKGTVCISFAKPLKQYLIKLTERFTQYELYNIMALKSKYAIRLFELFKSYSYQREKEFEIDELKILLNATNYKNFNDLKKRVLEPSLKEINHFTELDINYTTKTKGRKVVSVKFIIVRKAVLESFKSYLNTIEKINERNKIIKGQMRFDKNGNIYEE